MKSNSKSDLKYRRRKTGDIEAHTQPQEVTAYAQGAKVKYGEAGDKIRSNNDMQ